MHVHCALMVREAAFSPLKVSFPCLAPSNVTVAKITAHLSSKTKI